MLIMLLPLLIGVLALALEEEEEKEEEEEEDGAPNGAVDVTLSS